MGSDPEAGGPRPRPADRRAGAGPGRSQAEDRGEARSFLPGDDCFVLAERAGPTPRLGRRPRSRSLFGLGLDRMLAGRRLRASQLAQDLGVTPSCLSALARRAGPVSPERVEEIAASLGAEPEERVRLPRAAARDRGFRLDLPDGF